jgi:plastocyanin
MMSPFGFAEGPNGTCPHKALPATLLLSNHTRIGGGSRRTIVKNFGWRALLVALVVVVAGTAVACGGGDDDNDNGDTSTPMSNNGDNGNGDDNGDDNGDAEDGVLTLVSKNTLYDKTELSAKAGEITIKHDNQDPGIVHNVHVYKGSDATGEDMGATELEAGPGQQTLVLNLEPGEYFYVCDAHPATMSGTLTVE